MASNIEFAGGLEDKVGSVAPSIATPKKKNRWKRKMYLFLFLLLLSGVFWFLFLRPYSEGYRDGYVTKLSKKGIIFKTWEGELIRNQFSAATEKDLWKFSISDPTIAEKLNKTDQRKYIKMHYKEYLFQFPFKGDTKYFIDEIVEVSDGIPQNQPVIPTR